MKISIITVCFNSDKYIEKTIQSVLDQEYDDINYIVIDGVSTDNTIKIINKYDDKIDYFISEKDKSMYDAINKGLDQVKGDYVLVLNSDDYLYSPQAIKEVVDCMNKNPGLDFYYGNIIKLWGNGKLDFRKSITTTFKEYLCSEHGTFIPHPALLVNSKTIKSLKYSLDYKFAADFDYTLSLVKYYKGKKIDVNLNVFRQHEESITASGKLENERKEILEKYGIKKIWFPLRVLYFYKGWFKYLYQSKFILNKSNRNLFV